MNKGPKTYLVFKIKNHSGTSSTFFWKKSKKIISKSWIFSFIGASWSFKNYFKRFLGQFYLRYDSIYKYKHIILRNVNFAEKVDLWAHCVLVMGRMSIRGGGLYGKDDRIGWCEAGGNECEIDFLLFGKGGGLEDSERNLQTVDVTWQAVLALSGSFLSVDFNH
jgi:hypothetical protein